MVKVQIPVGSDAEDDDNEVGIMSDIEESDVDDDIGDPDWEELETKDNDEFSFKPGNMSLPANGVTISIGKERPKRNKTRGAKKRSKSSRDGDSGDDDSDDYDEIVPKKKRTVDINEIVRKSINRVKITDQLMKHKFSLLVYLARGLRLVKIINCNIIQGLSVSILDNRFKFKAKQSDRLLLETFMDQFNDVIAINNDDEIRSKHMQQPFMVNLLECYANCETTSLMELVVMFVACLKALRPKLPLRIVNVLRPITLRADIIPKPPADGSKSASPDDKNQDTNNNSKQQKAAKVKKEDVGADIIEKLDFWVEVFLADEKRWCCLDLCNAKLDEPSVLVELSRPFNYLVSYDVDRYCIKPAERNYCENWYTPAFRKGRCEDKWWDKVMSLLGPEKLSEKDIADSTKTEEVLQAQDMPTSDSGYRNHPLYVLQRHLLKFQAIYPPEIPPLGYFKDAPVYPRECVHTVRSRETWLREARTVKLGESPYKIVTARPKWDKVTGQLIRDIPLELFGEWQTQEYDPPSAENGKVPRNAYGNVDMYKDCMLPKGCSWLKLPGLPRIANKLAIDCASAVVGFDNHCGSYGAHPVIDGFIVCEEHAETLQMAWEEEQVNMVKREEEKRQKRIWGNWKRLLKAAMIREKLRVKYKNS